MKRFLLQLCLLSIITGIGIWVWNTYSPEQKQLNDLWLILIFFMALTAIIHFFLIRSGENKPTQFIRNFMGATALKLFIYLLIMVAYRFLKPSGAVVFLVAFLIHYLIFTVFEVFSILNYFKKK